MEIKKKTWPEYFEAILSGEKKFDVRLDREDFNVNIEDVLIFEERIPEIKKYTERVIRKKITYIMGQRILNFGIEGKPKIKNLLSCT